MRRGLPAAAALISASIFAVAAASAQVAAPASAVAATTTVDPARLAAARIVVDLVLPPATREQMIDNMIAAQSAQMRQSFTGNPQFAKTFGEDPRIKQVFDDFLRRMSERSRTETRASLPDFSEAMARAYARRFELRQLEDLRVFFETPTGRTFTQSSFSLSSDPDVAAWRNNVMAKSMNHLQEDMADFARQAYAINGGRCAEVKPCTEAKR